MNNITYIALTVIDAVCMVIMICRGDYVLAVVPLMGIITSIWLSHAERRDGHGSESAEAPELSVLKETRSDNVKPAPVVSEKLIRLAIQHRKLRVRKKNIRRIAKMIERRKTK
jgi:hypothetical protein